MGGVSGYSYKNDGQLKKTWRDGRHKCAKDCGIGAALDRWNEGVPADVKQLDYQIATCKMLRIAIANARAANSRVRDVITNNLLDGYDLDLATRRDNLKALFILGDKARCNQDLAFDFIINLPEFEEHVIGEISSENLYFLRHILSEGKTQSGDQGKYTYEQYVKSRPERGMFEMPDSSETVAINLPSQIKGPLDTQAADEDYSMNFTDAFDEIESLVMRDTYSRFYDTIHDMIDTGIDG